MSTEKASKIKKDKSKHRENKSSRICKGIIMNILRQFFIIIRVYVERLVDFMFSIYWEPKRVPIPDLSKRHAMLAKSAVSLAAMIRNKELKSEDLVQACIERIKEVNPIINAITDERFDAAIKEAKDIDASIEKGLTDEYFREKPFLGVPFTTKESMAVAGMLHTLGTLARAHRRAERHAAAVRLLVAAGALPLAVTNVPEINKWQETRNMIYGQTNNPYHTGCTVGGSSGGEAALAACCATPISLCSDIGGSTRMPAFFCGLYGYNPTAGYTNLEGNTLRTGKEPTMASVGFVSRHVGDLGPLTAIVAADRAPALHLDRPVSVKELHVFYMETSKDPFVSPVGPAQRRAMTAVLAELSKETSPQPFYHRGFDRMYRLWRHAMTLEAEDFARLLTDNRARAVGVQELAKKLVGASDLTLAAVLKLLDDQVMPRADPAWADQLIQETVDEVTRTLGTTGVLVLPSAPAPAPYHYAPYLKLYNFAYWAVLNTLKMPAVQVPVGVDDAGLPLGVQVAAAPGQDALCLAAAQYLARALPPPSPCRLPA